MFNVPATLLSVLQIFVKVLSVKYLIHFTDLELRLKVKQLHG